MALEQNPCTLKVNMRLILWIIGSLDGGSGLAAMICSATFACAMADHMSASRGNGAESRVKAVLGPTNTGKTHLAIERLCAHSSGAIGFPLRLLAREVYDRVCAIKARQASL